MADTRTKEQVLGSLPALRHCRRWELDLLATQVDEVRFRAGDKMRSAGPICRELLIVAEGELVDGDGRRIIAGDVVGAEEMADLTTRPSNLRAVTPGRLLVLSRAQYRAWRSVVAGVPADARQLSRWSVRFNTSALSAEGGVR